MKLVLSRIRSDLPTEARTTRSASQQVYTSQHLSALISYLVGCSQAKCPSRTKAVHKSWKGLDSSATIRKVLSTCWISDLELWTIFGECLENVWRMFGECLDNREWLSIFAGRTIVVNIVGRTYLH